MLTCKDHDLWRKTQAQFPFFPTNWRHELARLKEWIGQDKLWNVSCKIYMALPTLKTHHREFPCWCNGNGIQLETMRLLVRSLALLSGLRIQRCHELLCRLQTWLRSGVAVTVAKASSYRSNWTPSLGTSICHRWGPRKDKKTKKNYSNKEE